MTSCQKCVSVVPADWVGNDVVRIVPRPFLPTGHTKTEMSHNLPIPRTESRSRASQECCSTTKNSSVLVTARASPSRGAYFHESSVRKVPKSSRSLFSRKNCFHPHQLPRRCVGEHKITPLKARTCWIHELTCKARPRKCHMVTQRFGFLSKHVTKHSRLNCEHDAR